MYMYIHITRIRIRIYIIYIVCSYCWKYTQGWEVVIADVRKYKVTACVCVCCDYAYTLLHQNVHYYDAYVSVSNHYFVLSFADFVAEHSSSLCKYSLAIKKKKEKKKCKNLRPLDLYTLTRVNAQREIEKIDEPNTLRTCTIIFDKYTECLQSIKLDN